MSFFVTSAKACAWSSITSGALPKPVSDILLPLLKPVSGLQDRRAQHHLPLCSHTWPHIWSNNILRNTLRDTFEEYF